LRNLNNFRKQLVLVVGDMMVDKYIMGSVERISPEAPVPVLRQKEVRRKPGGTGNVIMNLLSLGAKVRAIGRIGDDYEGCFFRKTLQKLGVDDHYIFAEGSTIVKTRVSASNQQFIRIDEETILPPSDKIVNEILADIENIMQDISVVVISDYAKGFITEGISQAIIKASKERNIPVFVDPKGKSAAKYKGATAITPNNKEFMDLTGLPVIPDDEDIIQTEALRLCRNYDFDYLVFTRSEKGISIINSFDNTKRDYPAVIKEVVDVTGAGDTVISAVALAFSTGFNLDECAIIANTAASIVISKFGTVQTTIEELSAALLPKSKVFPDLSSAIAHLNNLKKQGKRIVFTNGCFDIVHSGHVSSFRQARRLGDVLVVGLNTDESIQRIKGSNRPIIDLQNRITLLSALDCVDIIIPFDEDTPQNLIEQVKPDVLVKGKDWEGYEIAGGEFVRSYGGRVEFLELEQGLSTSNIINKIKQATERGV